MRAKSITTLIVFTLFVFLSGCHQDGGKAVSQNRTLTVGAVLSLTGPAASFGSDANQGAQLALDEFNGRGGPFSIRYRPLDDKSDKTEAEKVARTLIDVDSAQVILGPAISQAALSVGQLAQERQIPMIGTSPTLDEVTASSDYDRTFVFRVCFSDSFQGVVLARFVHDTLGKKRVAIVYDKTLPYSIGLSKTFRRELERLGGVVVQEENYSVRDTDYSALIDKVARFDAEALFIPGWDENVGPMLKQAGRRWNRFVLVGGDAWATNRLLELAGGNVHNAYALSHYAVDDPDSRVARFRAAFKARFGGEPSPFAALGYDAMNLIADAAGRAKSFSGNDLREALRSTQGLPLVTGTISFDRWRNPIKDAVVVRIEPDRMVFHSRVRPEAS